MPAKNIALIIVAKGINAKKSQIIKSRWGGNELE